MVIYIVSVYIYMYGIYIYTLVNTHALTTDNRSALFFSNMICCSFCDRALISLVRTRLYKLYYYILYCMYYCMYIFTVYFKYCSDAITILAAQMKSNARQQSHAHKDMFWYDICLEFLVIEECFDTRSSRETLTHSCCTCAPCSGASVVATLSGVCAMHRYIRKIHNRHHHPQHNYCHQLHCGRKTSNGNRCCRRCVTILKRCLAGVHHMNAPAEVPVRKALRIYRLFWRFVHIINIFQRTW